MSMTTEQAEALGKLIAEARRNKGLSLRKLADALDVAKGWLGSLEQGRYVDPAPDRLARLAEALDIAPEDIDHIAGGAVAGSLPEMRTYFRAKYALTPEEAEQVERYVRRMRRAA